MAEHAGEESQDRLGEALSRLDPRSRRLVELWLAGLGRREIAAEMRIRDDVVAAIGGTAFRRLRQLLDGDSGPGRPADGEAAAGPGTAMTHLGMTDLGMTRLDMTQADMTHSGPAPGCLDESPD